MYAFGSPQHEEVYERVSALRSLGTTGLGNNGVKRGRVGEEEWRHVRESMLNVPCMYMSVSV